MKAELFFILWILAFTPAMLSAQENGHKASSEENYTNSLKDGHKINYIGDGDEPDSLRQRQLIDMFYYDQFRNFNDPRAPYFLLMSRDAKLAMGIGGVVRMRGWFDWDGRIDANGFIPYMISVPADNVHRKKIGGTPAGTALYFRVLGRNLTLGDYQLYIEANFNGYQSKDFALQKAYAIINDWTIGYANSTFSDPQASPALVDGQGPNASVRTTSVLLRWMHSFGKHWEMAASAEMPRSRIGADGLVTQQIDDYVPDIAAFVQYVWGYNEHVRLSGILRTLPYRNLPEGKNMTAIGWGVQMSSVFRLARPLTVYATLNAGQGYGGLTNDLLIGNYDLLNDTGTPGKMYAPWAWGWFGAVQCYLHRNVFISCTFGQMRHIPDAPSELNGYKRGSYAALNIFWNLTPRIQVAGEFNWGQRKNFSGETNDAKRVSLVAQFAF